MSAIGEVRDKIRFYVITIPDKDANEELVEIQKQYKAEELPKLMILETYDAMNDNLMAEE